MPKKVNSILTNCWVGSLVRNLRKLDKFVVLTRSDYEHWPELDNKIVIPNFISDFPSQPSSLKSKNVIAVGRYTWQKGFDLLIDAWCMVTKHNKDWMLHIYGPGDNDEYQRMADEKGVGNRFVCHSYAKNVYEKYLDSSIFVLSSRYEGFGLVLAEAMASGLPSVAFSCPDGPADIVTDGVDGILVESGNVEKLAEGLLFLINHEEKRILYGSNACKNMQRYDKDNIMRQWIHLFESL